MKYFKQLTLIIFFCSFNVKGQTNNININFLLTCFEKGQTDILEHNDKLNFKYVGIDNNEDGIKTLKFKSQDLLLNLTYEVSFDKCVFLQLVMSDDKLFYKIKNEILNFKPKLINTYNDDNDVISVYEGNKYTYKIITGFNDGYIINVIIIMPNK